MSQSTPNPQPVGGNGTVVENGTDCPRCARKCHMWPLRNGYAYYECRACHHTGYRRRDGFDPPMWFYPLAMLAVIALMEPTEVDAVPIPERPEIRELGICVQLGRCAYDVAAEKFGEGQGDHGCEWWADCFGTVVDA